MGKAMPMFPIEDRRREGDEPSLSRRACDACGSWARSLAFVKDGREIFRCPRCAFLFVESPETDPAADYGRAYFVDGRDGYRDYLASRELKLRTARARLALLERFVPRGRLLEIGCAAGFFLEAGQERGWEVEGFDPSPEASAWAQERGFAVRRGSIETAGFKDESFDAVVMLDVLEHLPRPLVALERCRRLLRPGGALLVDVPNVNGALSRLMGFRSPYFRPRVHLSYFSKRTLATTLRRRGFRVLYLRQGTKYYSVAYLAGVARTSNPALAGMLEFAARALGRWSLLPFRLPLGNIVCVATPLARGD